MFLVSKFVEAILSPSNLIAFVAVLGLVALALRWRRLGRGLLVASTVLLIICGWTPLGPALVMSLEDRFPIPALPDRVDGIVMLGGAVDTHITADRGSIAMNDNAERIFAVADLARRYPQARIVLSGGAAHLLIGKTATESEIARQALVAIGLPPDRVEMDERSRTTYENASESLIVVKPKPGETWLLVTSAYNMPRAVASFQAVGFPVVPYPVDFRTRTADLRRPVNTVAGGLELSDIAAHELLGLLIYRLAGRTQSLMPQGG